MSNKSPRLRLPVNPSLEHLQKQAKRLVRQDPTLKLADAQLGLARDYGCKNWAELARIVETMSVGSDQRYNVKRAPSPLAQAAREANLEVVREILQEGNYTPHDLDRALGSACWYGDTTSWRVQRVIADRLLEHGADPDGQSGGAYGPIVLGTGECIRLDGLQYLIEAGADVTFSSVQTKYGSACPMGSILSTYMRGKNDEKHRYIDLLVEHGAYIPPVATPPIFAIHRGDAKQLGELIAQEPGLVHQRFRDLPYGNMLLRGATLLHCAVDFGEQECIAELLKRGADINAPAEIIDGIGGQTPIFHAIATNQGNNSSTLEYLVQQHGKAIDLSISATWQRPGEVQAVPMTPLEYVVYASREEEPPWKRATAKEVALLRELASRE